jgi:hypothetical protein
MKLSFYWGKYGQILVLSSGSTEHSYPICMQEKENAERFNNMPNAPQQENGGTGTLKNGGSALLPNGLTQVGWGRHRCRREKAF